MKRYIITLLVVIALTVFEIQTNAKMNDTPAHAYDQPKSLVVTSTVRNITASSVEAGGTPQAKQEPTEVGVCWSTVSGAESINGNHLRMDTPSGYLQIFSGTISNLQPNTVYYVKAYIKYSNIQIGLGNEISFKTLQK